MAGVLVWSLNLDDDAKGKDAKVSGGPAASSSAPGSGGTATRAGRPTPPPSAGPATASPAKSAGGGSAGGANTPAPTDLLTPRASVRWSPR
ncbi:hypothetical protein ACFQ0M_03720 [Kitasatospora aburaviensis]